MRRFVMSVAPSVPDVVIRRIGVAVALLPGIFLLGMGMLALWAPKLLAFLAAVFFLYLGSLAMIAGWKILQWRRKAISFFEQVGSRVEFQGGVDMDEFAPNVADKEGQAESRKIIVH